MKTAHKPLLRAFEYEDFRYLNAPALPANILEEITVAVSESLAFVGVTDDGYVGAAGLCPLWDGVAHAWLIPGPLLKRYKKWAFATILWVLRSVRMTAGLWRIQTYVRADDAAANRLVAHLGFTREGTLRRFGPDKADYHVYARVEDPWDFLQ